MASSVDILAFAGSTRVGSYNRQVLRIACDGAAAAGAVVKVIDLKDYALPLYDADLERTGGLPTAARRLRELATAHAGLLIASPEYNGGYTPLLKNTLDWMSRSEAGSLDLSPFRNKCAAVVSASPGRAAGLRGLAQISAVLGHLGLVVMPFPCGVAQAATAFAGGELKDPKLAERVRGAGGDLVRFLKGWSA